jgi:hypothetical protein
MPKNQAPRSWAKTRVTELPARARWAPARLVYYLAWKEGGVLREGGECGGGGVTGCELPADAAEVTP